MLTLRKTAKVGGGTLHQELQDLHETMDNKNSIPQHIHNSNLQIEVRVK
jgi:hypothetical protein